jgi:hypothetical protein
MAGNLWLATNAGAIEEEEVEMSKPSLLIAFFLMVGCASAQSLKPEDPYPLQAGINKGTADSLVGTQYWYFYAMPGNSQVKVRFANATALYGAQIRNTTLTITLTDNKRTWRNTKVITPQRNQSEATFTADKVKTKMRIIISVAPPNQNLIRMGGDYEVEATGDVQFDEVKSSTDPIVRTYEPKVAHYSDSYGTTKFLADGTVETANGFRGTWKLFDHEHRIYAVEIEGIRYSVQYLPGYGLVKPDEPNSILFQELRR